MRHVLVSQELCRNNILGSSRDIPNKRDNGKRFPPCAPAGFQIPSVAHKITICPAQRSLTFDNLYPSLCLNTGDGHEAIRYLQAGQH